MRTTRSDPKKAMAMGLALGLACIGGLSSAEGTEPAARLHPPLHPGGAIGAPDRLVETEPVTERGCDYQPPRRGAPMHRFGGGTRGIAPAQTAIVALAPDAMGRTMHAQPDLYWYIQNVGRPVPVVFTLLRDDAERPEVEVRIPFPTEAGVHRIRMADHGVTLHPCHGYQWSVALVPDPRHRSKDIVAMGRIQRVGTPTWLNRDTTALDREGAVRSLAEAGLWYDAFMVVAEQVDRAPEQETWREYREALLERVGLRGAIGDARQVPAPSRS